MRFRVLERFKRGDPQPMRARFARSGRLLSDGVMYHASWVDAAGTRCFQGMEARQADSLAPGMERWSDLIDFQVAPGLTSADFWPTVPLESA